MSDAGTLVFCILLYLFEGYCIQFFFRSFAEPKLPNLKGCHWAVGAAWTAIEIIGRGSFRGLNGAALIGKVLFSFIALFVFCAFWYRENCRIKLFLTICFISLHELAFLAGYSLMYVSDRLIALLACGTERGAVPIEHLPLLVEFVSCLFVALVTALRGMLLYVSIRKIVKSCRCRENEQMEKEVIFYVLPAVAGILIAVLVRLLLVEIEAGRPVLLYERYPVLYFIIPMTAMVLLAAIVFGFWLYQEMAGMQKERTEKIVLENQIAQMQNAMVEMEHLYDGIRSVKHDMKNHMTVLQELIQTRYQPLCEEDAQIRHYFEGMYQSVEQLDNRVHTGNTVSDAVINSKFRYAKKKIKDIRLNAADFMLTDAVAIKAYDIGIILNNGLDNAIEACIKMRKREPEASVYITIRSFWTKKKYFFIEIENSFDGVLLPGKDSSFPMSTKENKEVHGIGLRNIKNCAVKYGGDVDCIVEGSKFILSVMVKG